MNAPDHNTTTESEQPQSKTSFRSSGNRVGVGVAIGTAIGAAYGASSGHMGQSIAMGVALNAALGAAFSFNPRGSSYTIAAKVPTNNETSSVSLVLCALITCI